MITFSVALVALILGYFIYGALTERVFGIDKTRQTPCYTRQDGVDYMPMPTWRVFLIQFLNIAGTGPIFGAIMGILFGPAAYLWIVLGCIFGGAVHDYMSGMLSLRKGGVSLPELVGDELGVAARMAMRVGSLVLLVLIGAVFVKTPADLLGEMTAGSLFTPWLWAAVIFVYYIVATLLPIDTLIGKMYPVFGIALLIMAVGIGVCIYVKDGYVPELTDGLQSMHPKGIGVFPTLCITIACGAISGFHGTQSPLMARCMKNEAHGRRIFYGAMIAEGIVALIWAAGAIKFFGTYEGLAAAGGPTVIVNKICSSWLGTFGAVLAILGVVAAPVTSGDTALRSARLITADFLHLKQNVFWKRLVISLPLFTVAAALMFIDFDILWRYFAWVNQTLATITLWTVTAWLARQHKCYWLTLLPALFMTVVCTSYIIISPKEGLGIDATVDLAGYQMSVGILCGIGMMTVLALCFALWLSKARKRGEKQ